VLLVDFFFEYNATINTSTVSISLYTRSGSIRSSSPLEEKVGETLIPPLEEEVGGVLTPLETSRISN